MHPGVDSIGNLSMPPRLLTFGATILTASASLMAQPPAALPDDKRGRFVQLFLETINRPTAKSVAAFEAACEAPASMTASS
jgi:hypothetical protein